MANPSRCSWTLYCTKGGSTQNKVLFSAFQGIKKSSSGNNEVAKGPPVTPNWSFTRLRPTPPYQPNFSRLKVGDVSSLFFVILLIMMIFNKYMITIISSDDMHPQDWTFPREVSAPRKSERQPIRVRIPVPDFLDPSEYAIHTFRH